MAQINLSLDSFIAFNNTLSLPCYASRHVLIMCKLFEGEGKVVFRAFPVGIPILLPQPHPVGFVVM